MTPHIRLPEKAVADARTLCRASPDLVATLAGAVNSLGDQPQSFSGLRTSLKSAVPPAAEFVEPLLQLGLFFNSLLRQLTASPSALFDGVTSGLRQADLTKEELSTWEQVRPLLLGIFERGALRSSAKALALAYEHSLLLQSARIFTDMRPVYDEGADNILGSIVSHTLFVRYDSADGDHAISLAVDENDIKSLIAQCERALKKSHVLTKVLLERSGMSAIVPGAETDE